MGKKRRAVDHPADQPRKWVAIDAYTHPTVLHASHVVPDGVTEDDFQADVTITTETLTFLVGHPDRLKTPALKALRTALHALQASSASGKTLAGRVTDALAAERWWEALSLLHDMRMAASVPALGAVCRWVRLCDAAHEHDTDNTLILQVLDAILRTADPTQVQPRTAADAALALVPVIRRHAPWYVGTGEPLAIPGPAPAQFEGLFRAATVEAGATRQPPNKHDLTIFTSTPGIIRFEARADTGVTAHPMAHVPGAVLLATVLSRAECTQLLAAAATMGYRPDEPIGTNSRSVLADAVVWVVDKNITDTIMARVSPHLPPHLGGGALAGLNARWRFYRYSPGTIALTLTAHGQEVALTRTASTMYVKDIYGDRYSRLTFLLYLNDGSGFEGGHTTFFVPSATVGCMDAIACTPSAGAVLCFPHGDTGGALLHEGSAVTAGHKYIVRTDVLYKVAAVNPAKPY